MTAKKRAPARLGTVAARGNRLATLRALRNKLGRLIDDPDTSPSAAAALAKRLTEVLAEIEGLTPVKVHKKPAGETAKSVVDEIAERRSGRKSTTSPAARAARGRDRG